ncbi:hypothetical protein D9M73_217040 [compost metagenome]
MGWPSDPGDRGVGPGCRCLLRSLAADHDWRCYVGGVHRVFAGPCGTQTDRKYPVGKRRGRLLHQGDSRRHSAQTTETGLRQPVVGYRGDGRTGDGDHAFRDPVPDRVRTGADDQLSATGYSEGTHPCPFGQRDDSRTSGVCRRYLCRDFFGHQDGRLSGANPG